MDDTINLYRHGTGHYVLSKLPLVSVARCCPELDWLCEIYLEAMPYALRQLIVSQLQFGDWAKLSRWQFFARESELPVAAGYLAHAVRDDLPRALDRGTLPTAAVEHGTAVVLMDTQDSPLNQHQLPADSRCEQ